MRRPLFSTSLALAVAGLAVTSAVGVPAQASPVIAAASLAGDTAIGTYYPVTNQRILDTRTTNGGHKAPLVAKGELALQVGGRAGVPAGNAASAVVLNLTGVLPTAPTYLTAYPSGTTRPGVSSINLPPKAIRANLVTVPVGADGKVKLYNNAGSVNAVVDVMGFYARTDIQGTYGIGSMYGIDPNPERLYDTRVDDGGAPLLPGDSITLSLDYGDVNPDVRAMAVNITAITPTTSGYLTAWDGSDPMPGTSNVNFVKGQVVPNMAVVPVRLVNGLPEFVVANGPNATTDVAVDIVGAYVAKQTEGLRFTPLTPRRIVDTRNGIGGFKAAIGEKVTKRFPAPSAVANDLTYALAGNATAIAPTKSTFLTVFADGDPRPAVSNLNAAVGETAANATVVNLGPGNFFNVYNNRGNVNLALDVAGRFDAYTVPGTTTTPSARAGSPAAGAMTAARR
jgi:hypothetical protein